MAVALSLVHDRGTGLYMVSADGTQVVEVTGLPIGAMPMDNIYWSPGL